MGSNIIIVVFAVVVIGGMGSILGSILTGLGLGVIEGLTKVVWPEASAIVVFLIMAIVLVTRPAGLFAEPAADGPPRQGRVLGHRDQARAGARARRLSGLHAQGGDRPLLHRLRAAMLAACVRDLPAIRDPQRADGRDDPRTAGGATASNSSACTAWATPLRQLRRIAAIGLPHLRAGRQPSRSARLSGAPAARERRELLLRRRSPPTRPFRSKRCCGVPRVMRSPRRRRATRGFPLPRDLFSPSG